MVCSGARITTSHYTQPLGHFILWHFVAGGLYGCKAGERVDGDGLYGCKLDERADE